MDATLAPGKETPDTRGPSVPEHSVRRDLELNNVRSAHRGLGPRVITSRGSPDTAEFALDGPHLMGVSAAIGDPTRILAVSQTLSS